MGGVTRRETMYYFVRSCVRFVFWGTIVGLLMYGVIAYTNTYDNGIPDCELLHFPCETTTTIYDPYGYGG